MRIATMRRVDGTVGRAACAVLTLIRPLLDRFGRTGPPEPRRVLVLKLAEQGATVVAAPAIARLVASVGADNVQVIASVMEKMQNAGPGAQPDPALLATLPAGRMLLWMLCVLVLAIVLLLFTSGVFAPFIARAPFDKQNIRERYQKPSIAHPLGTDDLGRDIFSRIVYGARVSVLIGFGELVGTGLTAVVTDRVGKRRAAIAGMLLAAPFAALLGTVGGTTWLGVTFIVAMALGTEFSFVSALPIIAELDVEARAAAIGLAMAIITIARAASSALSGVTYVHLGIGATGAVSGAVCLLAAVALWQVTEPTPAHRA